MTAGIVLYERSGSNLEGKWTHEDIGGVFAREVVHDVPEHSFEGSWKVDIYMPDQSLFWVGEIKSTRIGDVFKLQWEGRFRGSGEPGSFIGIATLVNPELIVSSFEQIRPQHPPDGS